MIIARTSAHSNPSGCFILSSLFYQVYSSTFSFKVQTEKVTNSQPKPDIACTLAHNVCAKQYQMHIVVQKEEQN